MNGRRLAIVLGLVAGCFACAGRVVLPAHLAVNNTSELVKRMHGARSKVQSFTAEARLVYFGPKGRIKGSALFAAKRPASLRYEVTGPHGGLMEALATDGVQVQVISGESNSFVQGPATATNLDRIIALAPLHLDARGWVSLLFGEVEVPEHAGHTYDDTVGRFVISWPRGQQQIELQVDPHTARVVTARMRAGATLVTEVTIEQWDDTGLPVALAMRVPASEVDLRVSLRDVIHDPPELSDDAFHLQPPAGIAPELLGP